MRHRGLSSLLLVSLLFGIGFAWGADPPDWYALAAAPPKTPPDVGPVVAVEDGFDLTLRVPGLATGTTAIKGRTRGVIELPGAGVAGRLGAPRLPVLRRLVEVPPGAEVRVELVSPALRTLTLAELGLHEPLLAVQRPVPKVEGAAEAIPFEEDAALYAIDALAPAARVEVVDRAVVRGRHVALIEIRPVRYNPADRIVEVFSEATLRVRFEGGDRDAAQREKGRLASPAFDRWVVEDVIAPIDPQPVTPRDAGGGAQGAEGMLVVVNDAFADAVAPFVDWKQQTGFRVEVIRTSELGGSPGAADVKAAIQQRYDTWSAPALGFLLLVGDTDFTPIHLGSGGGNSQVTDNWYACLDGTDYLPDVAVARISTRTPAETAVVVDKLLTYERAAFADESWIKRVGFIGTNDSGYIGLIEGTHDDCIDTYYTPNGFLPTDWSHGYASCDRHYNTVGATTAEIAASIDQGRSLVNYSGHGGYTSWEGPTSQGSYDAADVSANANADMYPFVISNACITGTLAQTECFGETWQKTPGGGAIGFWGASNNSYWDEDDVLERALYTNIFPMDTTPALGVILNRTKLDLYNHYGPTGSVAYYYDMYNLLSDPSLLLWTREPRAWEVTYDAAQPIGESSFTVVVTRQGQPVAGALVAVRKKDEGVFEAGYTDASGAIVLQLDPAPQSVGAMEVTVTAHDYRPHEGTADIISPSSPWLVHRGHAIDDSAGGDGDGRPNPGETLLLPVSVENIGQQPGYALYGTLSTTTPQWCEVLDSDAAFPDLAPGEQADSVGDHYLVRVEPTAPDGAMLGFNLAWGDGGGASGTTSFSERVDAVALVLAQTQVDDSLGGNGNGVAGPGETVALTVELANLGRRDATGVSGSIGTQSPYVTIVDSDGDYPDIPAESQDDSIEPYHIDVEHDAPDQQPVPLTLTLSEAGSGFGDVIDFELMVSSCAGELSADVPHPISDNSNVESVLDYGLPIEISEINVHVDISHSYIGDLRVLLTSPDGTSVVLHDRSGGGTNDLRTWYDTETAPVDSLSVFAGETAYGTWTLRVEDHAGGDTGTIDDWSLEICGQAIVAGPQPVVVGHTVLDDGECDPDGVGDVGETVTLEVVVRNNGWGAATGLHAVLSSDASVACLDEPAPISYLGPGQEVMLPFTVLIGAVECVEHVAFTVDLQSAEGVWADSFPVVLEADTTDAIDLEDLESGGSEPPGWKHKATLGVDEWAVASDRNYTPGGTWSWFGGDSAALKDAPLHSPEFDLYGTSTLEFRHWIDLQSGYDGGVLELSVDSGASWIDLGPNMVAGAYDRSLSGTNPIAGRDAWTGSYDEWRLTRVDLTPWSGQSVKLRWRLTCDDATERSGWWIDDVKVHSHEEQCDVAACGVPGPVRIVDVVRVGDDVRLEWWDDPLCIEYRVWRSTDPTDVGNFVDVTAEDGDATDTLFLDQNGASTLYWLVQATGPDGTGPLH
ncbi:MAG: hypothetical protein GY716_10230 [bacterium]|nr:hypothetical protein [bacterium]